MVQRSGFAEPVYLLKSSVATALPSSFIFGSSTMSIDPALTQALDGKLAAVRAAGKDKGRALVVLTNGPKMSAYGAGSRFGWIHTELGLPATVVTGLTQWLEHGDNAAVYERLRDLLFTVDLVDVDGVHAQSEPREPERVAADP